MMEWVERNLVGKNMFKFKFEPARSKSWIRNLTYSAT